MWTLFPLALLGLALAGLGTIYVKRRRLDRENKAVTNDLLAASSPPAHPVPRPGDWDDLPTPIQRYLTHVLQDEQPSIQTVRLRQTGTFRSDGETSDWKNFSAIQHVTTHPPGLVWDASIEMMLGLSVRVLDAFVDGQGILRARLGGVLPVADPPPGPALDEGELLRYLAEAPPTALDRYAVYEAPVYAPCEGTVKAMATTHPDLNTSGPGHSPQGRELRDASLCPRRVRAPRAPKARERACASGGHCVDRLTSRTGRQQRQQLGTAASS